jgi:hypothetical protein
MTRQKSKRARDDAARRQDTYRKLKQQLEEATNRDLLSLLRSERPLTQDDRRVIADTLEWVHKQWEKAEEKASSPQRGRGRPRDDSVRVLAILAWFFYWEWKQENRRLGICDRGHADDMKQQACRLILDLRREMKNRRLGICDRGHADDYTIDRVREMMDRPRSRRSARPQ